jgi:hypothetical protein
MKISDDEAASVLREEAAKIPPPSDSPWMRKIEQLSVMCEARGSSRTHIAFLGTVILAKAVDRRADIFAIKPEHAEDNPNAFSARILSENVIVPLAAELGFSLGVTGRQPLNNQPYFRMRHLDDGTPVRRGGLAAFKFMLELARELQEMDEEQARQALRAFVAVRRNYQPRYTDHEEGGVITPDRLLAAIVSLVQQDSESGKRAQAVVAGLMDVFANPESVESGRINDPSRKYPGDVCVRNPEDPSIIEKALEVRDKPVSPSDVQIFAKKCVDMGVREACVVAVSARQQEIDRLSLTEWANGFGIGLTIFHGWHEIVDQALFWSAEPKPVAATSALGFIHERLVTVEASPHAVELWASLTRSKTA